MEKIIVLDFGGQYNQLIARRVRECHVYSEVLPFTTALSVLAAPEIKGIIFTGGPIRSMMPPRPMSIRRFFRFGQTDPWHLLWCPTHGL
jgi:GMP synthase (glutamine-hydrolysing)